MSAIHWTRYIPVVLLTIGNLSIFAVTITDGTDEGCSCFKIVTTAATWYYDKAGGGFTSIIDNEGNDWINFHMTPSSGSGGAAGKYRGIPNSVYNQDVAYNGAGHPGHEKCTSIQLSTSTITTKAGTAWEWDWEFFENHAVQTMKKVQPDKKYWFLYEGTPGGSYEADNLSIDYWGHNLTSEHLTPSTASVTGNWQWVYFGDSRINRVLYIKQHTNDAVTDQFYCMNANQNNDGMVVFGFGRSGASPQMTTVNSYTLGFLETTVHAAIKTAIESSTTSITISKENVQKAISSYKSGAVEAGDVQKSIDDYVQKRTGN